MEQHQKHIDKRGARHRLLQGLLAFLALAALALGGAASAWNEQRAAARYEQSTADPVQMALTPAEEMRPSGSESDIWLVRAGGFAAFFVGFLILFWLVRSQWPVLDVLAGKGVYIAALLAATLAVGQAACWFWNMRSETFHMMNVSSALSGGLLISFTLIAALRGVKARVRSARLAPASETKPHTLPAE